MSTTSTGSSPISKDEVQLTEYQGLRRMHARSDRFDHEGWVEAWTEFDRQGFRYRIVRERGSEYMRTKILRAVLKREQDLIAQGHSGRAAFTEENYEFGDEHTAEDGSRYVPIKPRRKEIVLLDGRMVFGPDGSLSRVEGRMAKNPSFWTSAVTITRHFATIEGVRVPVSTESVAKVKFAGQSRLDVVYEYDSINGRPLSSDSKHMLALAAQRTALPR